MKIQDWLDKATKQLIKAGIATARLDVLVLSEDVLLKDRAWILSHPDTDLTTAELKKLKNLLSHRIKHEPLAYLRQKTEFYGREFIIKPGVLEPRPESEAMIDCLKQLAKAQFKGKPFKLADVGAGSGALGITALLELPEIIINLIEIDPKAIKIAKMNVDKFTLNISILRSDLLESTPKDYDLLLCNLPYVPDEFHINLAATHEPRLAIFGGTDGLDIYRRLFDQINNMDHRPLYILTESLPPQHEQLADLALASGYELTDEADFIQVFRHSQVLII